jgi:SAM-dependent methyltransferase
MHPSSQLKMQAFRDVYLTGSATQCRVLDVGSMAHELQDTYRPLFDGPGYDYVGLDLEPGSNVDIVPADPYQWAEIPDNSFDAVITGQMLEHNPFFWITLAEITRVTKPGGLVCIIAPSAGFTHRYPLDCWRFYPDAASAMFGYVGLETVEAYVEDRDPNKAVSTAWADMMAIGRKPEVDHSQQQARDEHLAAIVATRPAVVLGVELPPTGPAISRYEHTVAAMPSPPVVPAAAGVVASSRGLVGAMKRHLPQPLKDAAKQLMGRTRGAPQG